MDEHPWQSSRDSFEQVTLPKLQKIGKEIGTKAQAGNEKAKAVIELYSTLHRSFDPLTAFRLDEALKAYETHEIPK